MHHCKTRTNSSVYFPHSCNRMFLLTMTLVRVRVLMSVVWKVKTGPNAHDIMTRAGDSQVMSRVMVSCHSVSHLWHVSCHQLHCYIVTCLGVWFGIGWLFWIIVLFPRNIKTARPVPQLCDNQGTHCCQPLTSSWVLGVQNMAIFLNKVIANCCPNCLHSLFIVGTWSEHKWASLMLSLESGYSDTDHQPG